MFEQLSKLGWLAAELHYIDSRNNPDRHNLTKDSYPKQEMLEMCVWCCQEYDWNKKLTYSARDDRYYKNEPTPNVV